LATFSLLIPRWVGARKSSFACDDYSIRNPFVKTQTISAVAVILITLITPLLIILITEIIIDRISSRYLRFKFRSFNVPALLVHIIAFEGYFQLGYVMQVVVNQVTKYAVGRLRPHFLTVCVPAPYNCTAGDRFVYDYTCTGDTKDVDEGRLSFYSGHSATAMYTATFTAIYLHARIGYIAPRIILSTVQTLLFTGGLFICYTRIQDYYHHPTDVLAGAIIGFLGAIYSCFAWADIWLQRGSYSPVHGTIIDEEDVGIPTTVKVDPRTSVQEQTSTDQP
ncbi:hypothetical protein PMAYCL1PPCAC_07691, partial [Pristionchus mayeri]